MAVSACIACRPNKHLSSSTVLLHVRLGTHACSFYQDQLALAERHLTSLVSDADSALGLLSTLASSFRAVNAQTSSFRVRCEDLISEQHRLKRLANDVGTDLHYYAYLEGAMRRLNSPGAGKLVEDVEFSGILGNLDACVEFMTKHVRLSNHRKQFLLF